jgi:hypothetical protein
VSKETEAKIVEAIDNAQEILERDALLEIEDTGSEFRGSRPLTQADLILKLAGDCDLFHTPDGTAYADVCVEGHRETFRIDGKPFAKLLKYRFYKQASEPATPEAVRKAIDSLEAKAQYDAPTRDVHVRVAEHDGALYVDLGDEDWSAVEIEAGSWRVIQNPPVRFCRFPGMRPLPNPENGNSVETLRRYLNLSRDHDFVLIVAWLLAALRAGGPYPVLELYGQQGSAKSTAVRILRDLIDPNYSPVRTIPDNERDLFVTAQHTHLLAFDNLSSVPPWLSDSLCRLATGGGHAARRLYTDDEETLFNAQRPLILNGIEQNVRGADLADRAIFVTLEPIPPERRISERELRSRFEQDRGAILGALLDMMAHGLRVLPTVKLRELPRMADFAIWAIACEGAAWRNGTFAAAFQINRAETAEAVLDADPVAGAVLELMMRTRRTRRTMRTQVQTDGSASIEWKGTATDLLRELTPIAGETMLKDAKWPKTANALSNRLIRAIPSLRERGICVTRAREGNDRSRMIHIRLDNGAANPSASSASSATEADRYEDEADTAQIEEARSMLADDFPHVDMPVSEEGESVDKDEKDHVNEMPPPPSPAPGTNTVDAGVSNAPQLKGRVAIRRPQKKVSQIQLPAQKVDDGPKQL